MLQTPHTDKRLFSSESSSALPIVDAKIGVPFATRSQPPIRLKTAVLGYTVIEFIVVTCSNLFALYSYHDFILRSWSSHLLAEYAPAAATIAAFVLIISLASHQYSSLRRQERGKFVWGGVGAISLAFSFFLTLLFFAQFGGIYSRGTLAFQFLASCTALAISRELFVAWLYSATRSNLIEARRVALIGDDSLCSQFADRLKPTGIRTVGLFSLPTHQNAKDKNATQEVNKLTERLRALQLDDVVILAHNTITPELLKFTAFLANLPIRVHVLPIRLLSILFRRQDLIISVISGHYSYFAPRSLHLTSLLSEHSISSLRPSVCWFFRRYSSSFRLRSNLILAGAFFFGKNVMASITKKSISLNFDL